MTRLPSEPHLCSTSLLFIRRYSCSATDIILSKNNWSPLPLRFTVSLESTPFYLFVKLILVPVPLFPTHLFLHPSSLLAPLVHHSAYPNFFPLSLSATRFRNPSSRSLTSSPGLSSWTISRIVSSELRGIYFSLFFSFLWCRALE